MAAVVGDVVTIMGERGLHRVVAIHPGPFGLAQCQSLAHPDWPAIGYELSRLTAVQPSEAQPAPTVGDTLVQIGEAIKASIPDTPTVESRWETDQTSDETTGYAAMSWSVGDVQTLWPKMSDAEAIAFLERNEHQLRDRLIEEGWEVMRSLRDFDANEEGLELDAADEDEGGQSED